eukprot:453-Heterococcus_DN1.PRE.1
MAAEQQQQHQLPLPEQIPLNDVDASVPYPVHLLSDADRPDSFSFREFMDEINLAEEPADDSTEPIAIASMASYCGSGEAAAAAAVAAVAADTGHHYHQFYIIHCIPPSIPQTLPHFSSSSSSSSIVI